MSKIGDLFVRLGLKKDEFSKGIAEAKRESSSFVDVLKNIGSKGKLVFGAVATAIGGVIMAVKNLAVQNQTLSDAWNRMSSGMAASWDTFRTAVASMDFSHLLSDMREANRLARDLYDAYDALGEINTSYNISLSKQLKTINGLKVQLRDVGLDDDKRVEAGNKLLKIYEELEKNPTRGLGNVSDKELDRMAKKLGYKVSGVSKQALDATRNRVEQFFIWLGSEAGESWNQAYANANNAYEKQLVDFQARQAKLPKEYQDMLKNYQAKVGDKDRVKMEEAVTAYYEQQAKYSGETLRIQTQINTIKAGQDTNKNQPTASPKAPQVNPELDAAARILKRAQDSAKNEIQLYYEKYQEEKALLEKYNIDTTALTQEYFRNINGIMEKGLDEIKAPLVDFEPVELELIDVDESVLEEFVDKIDAEVKRAQDVAKEFGNAVAGGFADSCQELMDQLMGLREFNPGSVVKALLEPLADMAVKAGTIIAAEGVATMAANSALKTFGETGWGAVAAGAALIAAGTAAKAGLAALASGGSTTTSTSGYTGGGTTAGDQNIQTEMTIYVEGRLSGSDIVLSGQKTVNSWNR